MAITNKDVEKLKDVFATKSEFGELKDQFAVMRSESAERHNEIMTTLDTLMKEKETAREDRIFAKAKDDEQDRRIDGLESRVGKIEAGASS